MNEIAPYPPCLFLVHRSEAPLRATLSHMSNQIQCGLGGSRWLQVTADGSTLGSKWLDVHQARTSMKK